MRPEAEPRSNAVSSRTTTSLRPDLRSGRGLELGSAPRSAPRSAPKSARRSKGRASPRQIERHARRDHDDGARDGRSRVDLARRTGARRSHTHNVFAPLSGAENSARVAPAPAGFHSKAGWPLRPPEPAQRLLRQQTLSTAHGRTATNVGRQNAAAARGPRSTYYGLIIS